MRFSSPDGTEDQITMDWQALLDALISPVRFLNLKRGRIWLASWAWVTESEWCMSCEDCRGFYLQLREQDGRSEIRVSFTFEYITTTVPAGLIGSFPGSHQVHDVNVQ